MKISGFHVQWPWSQKLLSQEKTIETRGYPLPKKYIGRPLALIETYPGLVNGKRKRSAIVGVIVFETCLKYRTRTAWQKDRLKHLVSERDEQFAFGRREETWGWVVKSVKRLSAPKAPPVRRGIKFVSECEVGTTLLG